MTQPVLAAGPDMGPGPVVRLNVAGIDPSLTGTGIADCYGQTLTIRTKRPGDQRLNEIEEALLTHILGVDLAVVEDLPTHAHGAGVTGMVQGVIRAALNRVGVPYVTVPAATLKKYATGNGGAAKPDMRMELYKRVGLDLRDDNQVDAWWLRAMGLDAFGAAPIQLPKTHRVALDKITWPEVTR